MAGTMIQPYCFQHFTRPCVNFSRFVFANQQRHRHVFQRGEIRQQMVELINKAELLITQLRFRRRRQFTHRLTAKNDIAGGRGIQPAQQVQQRTFAGAGAADNRHHFAFAHAEADIVQHVGLHGTFLIAFAQFVALQQDLIHNVKPQRVEWRQRARKDKA